MRNKRTARPPRWAARFLTWYCRPEIEEAYGEFKSAVKIIGFISLLAICISSLGLFGMVVYTMEAGKRDKYPQGVGRR